MTNERKFFRCTHCGNLVSFIHNTGMPLMCCGTKMAELTPNTSDGAVEKHVPVAKRDDCMLSVTVGSVPHPMTEEHYIAWIIAADSDRTQRVTLSSGQEPTADFCLCEDPVKVYAYCNLHGLWEAQL
jgi:superoxide reductase